MIFDMLCYIFGGYIDIMFDKGKGGLKGEEE